MPGKDRIADPEKDVFWKALVDSAREAVIGMGKSLDGTIEVWSRGAEEFYGYSAEEVIGRNVSLLVPPGHPNDVPEILARIKKGERIRDYETMRMKKDGTHVYVSLTVSPIRDAEGEIIGASVIAGDITRRKQSEEALAASEKRFRDFFMYVPVGMFIGDSEGNLLHANPALCRFLGYAEQELLGTGTNALKMITHPDDYGESLKNLKTLMAGEVPEVILEKRYLRKDGGIVWGRVSAARRLGNGSTQYIGIVEDIDDRRRAEEALRQSEERFRMFADFTYDWEYWISPEGNYIYVSPACEKVTGYGPGHFQSPLELLDLAHPEDRDMFAEHIKEHLRESSRSIELELRIVNRKGEVRWLSHACRPVFGSDGRFMGRRASNRDITERKNTEHQMKLFVDLVDQSNDGFLVVDLHTRLMTIVNDRLCRNLGYTRDELLAMRPEDISTKPEGFFDRHFRELRELETFLAEDYHRRKDGTTFPVEVNVKYIEVNDREFAVAVIRDISERKRLEQELQKAQRLESIGLLAGGIAHDFNNILTVILGNITLAQMFLPPGEKATEKLAVAEQASLRARRLSQQLLTFAKGGAPITKTITIPHLVREAVGLALRGGNVSDEYFFPEDLLPVEADEDQLNQAISNIVINATQAMPEGGIITAAAVNFHLAENNTFGLPAGNYIRIDIKDQGAGIPRENLGKIFDPYFTTKEQGSGLGLAISYSIVKRHGGTIIVDSESGKGSAFSIFLPALQERKVVPQEEEPEEIAMGTGRILVMDDDETVSQVAAEMLRVLGYQVETVRDGSEAITAYQEALSTGRPFDAVITDLTVPAGMGGKETVRRLLEIDPQARVIVSSGYGNDPIMSNYLTYGFKGVIPKPFRLADLSRTLQEVLGREV